MRYFTATAENFNAFRSMLIAMQGYPKNGTTEPWPEGITSIALAEHEYGDEKFAPILEQALAEGLATEITAEEYQALQPKIDTIFS